VEDDSAEFVEQGEDTEHDPVSEPSLVIIVIALGLQSLDALNGGLHNCDDGCKDGTSKSEQNDERSENDTCTQDEAWFLLGLF
jgi:hypothetical protein